MTIEDFFQFRPVGRRLEDLETPVPVIDLDIVERNLRRWQARCDALGFGNRPHIKTHKLVPLAGYQLALGARGITVQKLGEAEVMANAGIGDRILSVAADTSAPPTIEFRTIYDRPELGKALHLAKVTGATLVIAKLDRLSRNVAFLRTLRDSGVRFSAVDLPEANDLTVGIMALVAQQEREAISKRTREALAVAKARGVRLGNPNGAEALRRAGKGGAPLRAAIGRNADAHARDLAPVVADIRGGGATSLRAIAAELNDRGMLTRRGGRWHVSTVMNLLGRLGLREASCANPA